MGNHTAHYFYRGTYKKIELISISSIGCKVSFFLPFLNYFIYRMIDSPSSMRDDTVCVIAEVSPFD
jgi:hypothetical protein